MKMTKIESARIIVKQKGICYNYNHSKTISCDDCFNGWDRKKCLFFTDEETLALAKAYIKRHEQKTKKKDHILDTTKKVTRPNFRKYLRDKIDMKVRVNPELSEELQKIAGEEGIKTRGGDLLPKNTGCRIIRFYCCDHYSLVYYPGVVTFEKIEATEYNPGTDALVEKVEEPKPIKTVGIDNSDVTLALTAQYEPTPLQIAKMIRDNGYSCIYKNFDDCRVCPFIKLGCGHSNPEHVESFNIRKKLIDDYISANEPVKDCPANSEIPQPIKLPDFVYSASKNGVGFIDTKNRTFNTNDKGELLLNDKPCFATPEEALQVALKLWNGEGK